MLVLLGRGCALYALGSLFGVVTLNAFLLLVGAAASITLSTALIREWLRGATSRGSVYVGMDVGGPSYWGVLVVACIESSFYLVGFLSPLLLVMAGVFPLLMILSAETLLIFFRTRVVLADERIEVSRLLKQQFLRWDGLRVEHDGTYFRLQSGTKELRFRLASSSRKRFTDDLAKRGVVVQVVKPARCIPWGKR